MVPERSGRRLRLLRALLLGLLSLFCLFLVIIRSGPALGLLVLLVPLFKAFSAARLTSFSHWLHQLIVYYLKTVYRVVFLLGAQAAIIPLAFAIFPAGFFLLALNLISLAVGLWGTGPFEESLFLCVALDLDEASCVLAVVGVHLVQLTLVWLAVKKGERFLDRLVVLYARGDDWIETWLPPAHTD